jgi:hypothetical protein
MIRILFSVVLLFSLILNSFSQEEFYSNKSYDKNLLKVNLTGLFHKNYGLQYERMLSRKTSISLSYRTQFPGQLPVLEFFETLVGDPETFSQIKNITYANTAITPEIRFYLGKKSGPRGFYIAPYARYSMFDLSVPNFEFTFETSENGQFFEESRTVELNGDIKAITGGLMLGAQWRLGKAVYLDWWIIGGSFGKTNGQVLALTSLSVEEQNGLRDELTSLDIPLLDYTVSVDGNGAKLNFNGPFASLRGGISLGFRF